MAKPETYRIAGEQSCRACPLLMKLQLFHYQDLKVDGSNWSVPGEDAIPLRLQKAIGDKESWWCENLSYLKIEGEHIYLLLDLTERPRFSRVSFQGMSKTQKVNER